MLPLKRSKFFSNQLRYLSIQRTTKHPLFKFEPVTKDVWRIEEKYFDSWNLANMYFVRGSQSDLLIDTGIGVHDLPSFLLWSKLREDKEKPLIVALTHTHFDHSGGAFQFAESCGIFVHEREVDVMKTGSRYHTAAWVTPEEVLPKPIGWSAKDYHVKPVSNAQ